MAALSDFDLMNMIKSKRLVIEPFEEEIVRENGIDFRLDNEIAHHNNLGADFVMDPSSEESIKRAYDLQKNVDRLVLGPHEQVLLSTMEYIELPDDIMALVELRSTWARHGLSMPPTIVDAGFKGNITLEVFNNAPYGIALKPGTRFAHMIFIKTSSKVQNAYSGQYSGQRGVRLPKVIK
jgi:dCTP deaminase